APSRQNKKALRMAKERMYAIIDHATAENLSAPNFALYTDIASAISGGTEPQYMANKACKQLKKRLQCKRGHVQTLALQLLEHCVRTCGEPFHKELAVSELLPELVRLSDRSAWCPPEVQQHVLALLQEWAYTLRPSQFVNSYNKLKSRGMTFPPRSGEHAPSGNFQPYPGLSPGPPPDTAPPGSGRTNPAADLFGAGDGGHPGSPLGTPGRGLALLSPDQPPAKIQADLEVARNTVALLGEQAASNPFGGGGGSGVQAPAPSNPFASANDAGTSNGNGPSMHAPAPAGGTDAFGESWGVPAPAPPAALYPALYSPPGGDQAPASSAGVSDAFRDLLSLQKKAEEAPPPPKGSPMRRNQNVHAATSPTSNGADAFSAFDSVPQMGQAPPKI
ncbi:hypothetical protein APUTEX25_004031, partial [Auxenochlorella protothecoides]